MTTIYSTLTLDAQHALDVYEEAAYCYQMAHTEQNRVALESAREALLRVLRSVFVQGVIENDEAA